MKKTLAALSATTILALTSGALADDSAKTESKVKYKDNGGYESTQSSERTNEEGTSQSTETNVDVDVDSSGQVKKKVKTESTTDPKGMLNQQKDIAKTQTREKARGGYKQTVSRKHSDAAGTDTNASSSTDVDVDKEGNVTETTKTEQTVDPKGLLNKKKTASKTKTVNGTLVEQKTDSNY